jgi:hypothetical protein
VLDVDVSDEALDCDGTRDLGDSRGRADALVETLVLPCD